MQVPEADVRFLRRVYRSHFGRDPRTLREDFLRHRRAVLHLGPRPTPRTSPTASTSIPEPLAWGREHQLGALPSSTPRRASR